MFVSCVTNVGYHMSVVKVDSIYSLCTKNCQSAWGERHGGGGGGGGECEDFPSHFECFPSLA